MKCFFWCSLGVVLYSYAGYPAIMALFARLFPKRWKQSRWRAADPEHRVSIIMAVHNGAGLLESKLEHLLAQDRSLTQEIIVVSDGSTDATVAICKQFVDRGVLVLELPQRSGKAAALAHGIREAAGEILVFIDLRARLAAGALEMLMDNFSDPRIGCAGGELHLLLNSSDLTTQTVGGLYWRYERRLRVLESLFDSSVGLSGCFFAARASIVTPPPAGLILDDVFQPLSIIRKGYRSIVDPRAIVTDTLPETQAGEFSRKVRTLAGNYQLISEAPWVLSWKNRALWQFVSHKVLRLLVPYMFVFMLVSSAWLGFSSRTFAVAAVLQISAWLLALTGVSIKVRQVDRLLSAGRALLLLNAAAVAGLYVYLFTRGPLWKIWSPGTIAKIN